MSYHLQKTNLKRTGSSYIDSHKWLKNKKATRNPKNNDENYFQYATIAPLNHKQIKNHPERISYLKPFINQYDWKRMNFPSQKGNWKKFETNQLLLIFYLYHTMLKTQDLHTSQNIILRVIIR